MYRSRLKSLKANREIIENLKREGYPLVTVCEPLPAANYPVWHGIGVWGRCANRRRESRSHCGSENLQAADSPRGDQSWRAYRAAEWRDPAAEHRRAGGVP